MAIYKINLGKRIAAPNLAGGWYYWTNVYYSDAPDAGVLEDNLNIIVPYDARFCGNDVHYGQQLIIRLSDGHVYRSDDHFSHQNTFLPGAYPTLTNVLYVYGAYEDGHRFAKHFRVPLRDSDMESDGTLSAAALAVWDSAARSLGSLGVACSPSGSPLLRTRLSPLIHMWQLRDGTKRRSRNVLFP